MVTTPKLVNESAAPPRLKMPSSVPALVTVLLLPVVRMLYPLAPALITPLLTMVLFAVAKIPVPAAPALIVPSLVMVLPEVRPMALSPPPTETDAPDRTFTCRFIDALLKPLPSDPLQVTVSPLTAGSGVQDARAAGEPIVTNSASTPKPNNQAMQRPWVGSRRGF